MILWLNPVSGISGDMFLGALLGLGASLDAVRDAVRATGVEGWRLDAVATTRAGLRAIQAVVTSTEDSSVERTARELFDLVGRAQPAPVAALATRAVAALGEVEASLHGVPVSELHLHELGSVDTVVDTVGVAAALHSLGVTRVRCGPLALGAGTVHTQHGVLPVPAPATAALIARMQAPVVPAGVDGETVTPTGAALLLAAGAQFGPVPAMTVHTVGYGAGSREVDGRANVLQALLGPDQGRIETLIQLETNVDDVTGELLGYLIARLIAEGAADAWITPVVMKKGRPAHIVHALTTPDCAAAVESVLLAETGSLGLRRLSVERLALPRHTSTVEIEGHPVRVKHGPWGAKPEYEDVVRVAAALGTTLREVLRRVR
ncbi:MAG: nickel pincer cofactor biosynthesis protein LarC [Pseudonocardia sp.]|nr:nickel pincer cofactor biosynthesis protein LarC [Pseudonocardia sp.]